MIRICVLGAWQHRQPLAYAPIQAACADRIALVEDPARADLLVVAHPLDLDQQGLRLGRLMAARPGLRLVLLSEEPFWDTVWNPDPFARWLDWPGPEAPLPVSVISHETTALYDFDRIPYFLLTDPRYLAHYRPLVARNARLRPADWARHFGQPLQDAAFMAARRRDPKFSPAWPARDVLGLCLYRSTLAAATRKGQVLRHGKGWAPGPPRQELADWHADKLDRLDMAFRHVSALENTHQHSYVSEKLLDAFAVGAIPLYMAGPGHRVDRLVPRGSWLDLWGQAAEQGIDPTLPPDAARLEAYAEAQARLHDLLSDPEAEARELDRFACALVAELRGVLG
ncbi:Glycosyltransferase family 10 (fucosyltransferase) C-term [Gemmobacter megaterium]|uniref:Glycosyltransferase family 10 (Fucosyltransferase) C-term n=1 Tax=Gemmobacter megaterium TaxID=1086013 RepID=A0A1N7QFZ4_9RHOB|nr:glycosyltransferase family 10 [Gemmobacter megaterium]GGE25621.1 hypothetical protein GCM10011345_34450 [Gemmobacter megaterium]SIT21758.1 Glycosyltransferase family 10 (fucosyltransferase) C-term [Gemmobacter megaterium]